MAGKSKESKEREVRIWGVFGGLLGRGVVGRTAVWERKVWRKWGMKKGSTRVTRVIRARRKDVYESFLGAKAVARWLPPASMAGVEHRFEPREGARFRISLTYQGAEHSAGKNAGGYRHDGRAFAKLVPYEKIVEVVEFESEDATFAGEMRLIVSFVDAVGGTEVTMVCEDIPSGIRPEDNEQGCKESLHKLAALLE